MKEKKTKKKSNFDSLAFKEKEQKRLRIATKGMTWEQKVEYFHRKTLEGPFARLLKGKKGRLHAAAHEKSAPYKTR